MQKIMKLQISTATKPYEHNWMVELSDGSIFGASTLAGLLKVIRKLIEEAF